MYIGCLEVRIRIVIRSCMISVVLDGIQVPGMYIHYMCLCPLLVNNWRDSIYAVNEYKW